MHRPFPEFAVVRVRVLIDEPRAVTSSFDPAPQPKVGDLGTVLYAGDALFVESVDSAGSTHWLAAFSPLELELVAAKTTNT